MVQEMPSPRKTLTELLPMMLPMELSAVSSCCAAVFDVNVSGRLVPRATSVMAVISSGMPAQQPRRLATSPTRAVKRPMKMSATQKQAQPPTKMGGGTSENTSFQRSMVMWKNQSMTVASAWSSGVPLQYRTAWNWSDHRCMPSLKRSRLKCSRMHRKYHQGGEPPAMTTSQTAMPASEQLQLNLTPGLALLMTTLNHSSAS
mmetsp:Transcript_60634/g.141250  ORF Transcript_60634/g.141250 Transcript_60634/m.141250 type:complete len:202 (+) Transcript_60634:405-1010(+)